MTFTACEQDAADLFSTDPVAPVMDKPAPVLLTENSTVESVTFSWKGARNLEGDVLYTLYAEHEAETISLTTTTNLYYTAPKETLRSQLLDGFGLDANNNFSISLQVEASNGVLELASEAVTVNIFIYGDYVPAVASLGEAAAEGLVLTEDMSAEVELLNWTAARFEYGKTPTYKVEALFNEKRTELASGLTSTKLMVKPADFNGKLIAMGCTKEAANTLQLIVTAALDGEGAPSLESEAVELTVTPFTPSYPEQIKLCGDFGGHGWNPEGNLPILKGDNIKGEYHGLVSYYGAEWGMKLIYTHPKSGDTVWVGATADEDGVNYTISDDNLNPAEGTYLVYVNLADSKVKLTPVTKIGLIGVGGDWDNDMLFTYNAETGAMELPETLEHTGGEFKVRVNGGWGKPWDDNAQYNLGGDINDLTMDGSNLSPEAGAYKVSMNLSTADNFKLNLEKVGDVEVEDPMDAEYSLIGGFPSTPNWDADYVDLEKGSDVFTAKNVEIPEGTQFKIRKNHDWAVSFGLPEGMEKFTVGSKIKLGGNNIVLSEGGSFDIYFYPKTQECAILKAGEPEPASVVYALIGKFNEWSTGTQVVMEPANNGYVVAKNVNMTGVDLPNNGFKVKENVDNWDNNWGSGSVVELGVSTAVTKGGGNMGLAAEGAYDVYFNPTELLIIVVAAGADDPTGSEPAPEPTAEQIEVGLIGLNGDWSNDLKLTQQADGSYLAENVAIKASDSFKVRMAGNWKDYYNWGLESAGTIENDVLTSLVCSGVSGNISVKADGNYTVYFYPELEGTKVVRNKPAKIKVVMAAAPAPDPVALATPVVTVDPASVEEGQEKTVAVAWAAVENAASYDVVFNGAAAVNVTTNAYTIDAATVKALTKGEYKVSVVAKPAADATAYLASAAGEAKLVVTEAQVTPTPTPGAALEWSNDVWKALYDQLGGNETSAETIDCGNGLIFSKGGGKGIKLGETGGAYRAQLSGSGDASGKTAFLLTVSGPGTLTVDYQASGYKENEVRNLGVAINGTNVDKNGYFADPEARTVKEVDCSTAAANSTIAIYSMKSGIHIFSIKWTPKQ